MSAWFYSSITCQLVENVLPSPQFLWNITLGGAELPSSNVHYENDTLTLIGPIKLNNTSTLDVICDVSNIFGSDSEATTISLCSRLKKKKSLRLLTAIILSYTSTTHVPAYMSITHT